jgi:cbb3-type cytochrome oxidase maturation protein
MEVIYGLLPGMLILGVIGVAVFIWAVKSGQYDDLDGAAHRVLLDEENDDTDQNDEQEKLK